MYLRRQGTINVCCDLDGNLAMSMDAIGRLLFKELNGDKDYETIMSFSSLETLIADTLLLNRNRKLEHLKNNGFQHGVKGELENLYGLDGARERIRGIKYGGLIDYSKIPIYPGYKDIIIDFNDKCVFSTTTSNSAVNAIKHLTKHGLFKYMTCILATEGFTKDDIYGVTHESALSDHGYIKYNIIEGDDGTDASSAVKFGKDRNLNNVIFLRNVNGFSSKDEFYSSYEQDLYTMGIKNKSMKIIPISSAEEKREFYTTI